MRTSDGISFLQELSATLSRFPNVVSLHLETEVSPAAYFRLIQPVELIFIFFYRSIVLNLITACLSTIE